jgi:hypothetical protein
MSETTIHSVGFNPCHTHSGEEPMLQADTVQEVLARLARGESVKALARELGVDRKTVKRWRRLGQWRPRQGRPRPQGVDPYRDWLIQRGPEVGWNAMVLHRRARPGQWARMPDNVLIVGSTGAGKTYLACALAQMSCRLGFSSLYLRLPTVLSGTRDRQRRWPVWARAPESRQDGPRGAG